MKEKTYCTSAQSGIFRATIPIAEEQRENFQKLVRAAGARSLNDLIQVIVLSPEEAGQALAPLFSSLVGEERKRAALAKIRETAARDGLTLWDLREIFPGPELQ